MQKNKVLPFLWGHNCLIKQNDSTEPDYNLEGFFFQYIYNYQGLEFCSLKYFEKYIYKCSMVLKTEGYLVTLTYMYFASIYVQVSLKNL